MNKLFFITIFISFSSYANCFHKTSVVNFISDTEVLKSINPQKKINDFLEEHKIDNSCKVEILAKMLNSLADRLYKDAENSGCLDVPDNFLCIKSYKNELLKKTQTLIRWEESFEKNKTLPNSSIWKDDDELELKQFTSFRFFEDTINLAYSLRNLKTKLSINESKCSDDIIVSAKDFRKVEYFKKILLKKDIILDELLVLWNEEEEEYQENPYFFSCQSIPMAPLNKTVEIDGLSYLSMDCKPDVLYTWGSSRKIERLNNNLHNNANWSNSPIKDNEGHLERDIFMAMTPISTYGYGEKLVRFKIKKETPFIAGYDMVLNEQDLRQLEGVRLRHQVFQDFTLRNSFFIESYSFGTPQIYDELVRDIKRIKNRERAQLYSGVYFDWTTYKVLPLQSGIGLDHLFNFQADGYEFTEEILKQRLLTLIKMILNHEGRVIYQKGSCNSVNDHYKTSKRTYFNPN